MTFSNEYLITAILNVVVIGLLILKRKMTAQQHLTIPGPSGVPIFGHVLQIGRRPHLSFTRWAKQYGKIFQIKVAGRTSVVITDHKMIKELLSDSASTGRMTDNPAVFEFAKGPNGIINSQGVTWEEQRDFTQKTLKMLGVTSSKMLTESLILEEARATIAWFEGSDSKPISGCRIFNAPVVNTLWRIITGERCAWEKKPYQILDQANALFLSILEITSNGVAFLPALRHVAPGYLGWTRYVSGVREMFKSIDDVIEEHNRKTFHANNPRDYIDHYLRKIEITSDPNSSFYKDAGYTNMVASIFDLFIAGSETTANTLSWLLLYLSSHPKIQKKLQSEIDLVLGQNSPLLINRTKMPYTEAVISEVFRIATVGVGAPHCMQTERMFHGYHLPKGTTIFTNFYGVHHDPDIWGDPEIFRPERFLSEDETSYVVHKALNPFSCGRRKCLGETLARDTLFLFVASIFQKFQVVQQYTPNFGEKRERKSNFETVPGFFLMPKPFKIVMEPRKHTN